MKDRFRLLRERLGEQLWIRPLLMCLISIAGVFLTKTADGTKLGEFVPDIREESINTLLSTMSASMLMIATFAVGTMVTSYAAASSRATPRSFSLVIADDVSQNALSAFIGSFIYSVVGLIALENGYFERAARFALFVLTLMVFALVILTFVRWLDRIARLGRIQTTIETVEKATCQALRRRKQIRRLGGIPISAEHQGFTPVFTQAIGYLQCIDMASLQENAEKNSIKIRIASLPGTFCTPDKIMAYVWSENKNDEGSLDELDLEKVKNAFIVGRQRTFADDPRFGLVVLSEIAGKALSPAVNDPGTAINVIGSLVRLLSQWGDHSETQPPVKYKDIEVPELSPRDMFDDAFTAIARDGAGIVYTSIRLQKALHSLAVMGDKGIQAAALDHAQMAQTRAVAALSLDEEKTAMLAITNGG